MEKILFWSFWFMGLKIKSKNKKSVKNFVNSLKIIWVWL